MKLNRVSFSVAFCALLLCGGTDLLAKVRMLPWNPRPATAKDDGEEGGKGGKGGENDQGEDEGENEGEEGGDCGECTQQAETSLVRPDPAPDPDATGTLRIRSASDSQRFDVRVANVDTSLQHNLFLEDPADSDAFTDVGALDVHLDKLALSLDSSLGDPLPLGVTQVGDLSGRDVQIRQGDSVVLQGTVPALPGCDGDGGGGGGKGVDTAKATIKAPDGAPAPKMQGKLFLRSKPGKGQERIDLKVHHVPWGDGDFRVFVEDPSGSGTFTDVGDLDHKGKSPNGRYRRDTKHGQSLPLDADSVKDLAGRVIEVRGPDDVVYLRGTIPMAH